MHTQINHINAAISAFKSGKMVIVTDDPERENEGDLIIPAELITDEIMSFMIRHGSGIVCLAMTEPMLNLIELPLMVPAPNNTSMRGTPFTISIDAKEGITTGVSASDRVATIMAAIADHAKPDDLVKPGHIFPLQAKSGGVIERAGHTEGSVDLAKIAGCKPAAVLCEIMNDDGTMMRGEALTEFAKFHNLPMLSINDILLYRHYTENMISEEANSVIELEAYGQFNISVVREKYNQREHMILAKSSTDPNTPTLVRVHSSCATGDIFSSKQCDCHKQLHYSLDLISKQGGMLIYLNQEGRNIGLFNKIKSYALQIQGLDTVDANLHLGLPIDARSYCIAANILRNRQIESIRLLTNNPAKVEELIKYGVHEVQREAMPVFYNSCNMRYLNTKRDKLNHIFNINITEVAS